MFENEDMVPAMVAMTERYNKWNGARWAGYMRKTTRMGERRVDRAAIRPLLLI